MTNMHQKHIFIVIFMMSFDICTKISVIKIKVPNCYNKCYFYVFNRKLIKISYF